MRRFCFNSAISFLSSVVVLSFYGIITGMSRRLGATDRSMVIAIAAIAVSALFALYGFSGMFLRAYNIFAFAAEEDMSFAWFVPIFSIYVLWRKRTALVSEARRGAFSWLGLAASLPFLCLALLGTRGVQLRLEELGFIGLCVALPWTFFGWRFAKLFVFPAGFLLFCIPLATFLDIVTIHLRYLASSVAMMALNGLGFDAVREGTAVISRGARSFAVDVAEPCSGLRSLFALMALTAGYAYFNQPTWIRRWLLFLCSVPLAVAGNVVRIVSICLVASCVDREIATGFYHDYSGYIVFAVAILLMVVAGEAIDRIFARAGGKARGGNAEPPVAADGGSACGRWRFVPVAVAAAFYSSVFAFQARTPAATIAKAPDVSFRPVAGCTTDDERFADVQRISEAELNILPKDTRIEKKMYVSRNGAQFLVAHVIGGTSRASIHRPELCLPSQGYVMSNPRNLDVAGRPWHVIDIARAGEPRGMEAYTFFNQEGFRTASHTSRIFRDVIDRSVLNRVDRWVMVSVHAFGANEVELLEFLAALEDAT